MIYFQYQTNNYENLEMINKYLKSTGWVISQSNGDLFKASFYPFLGVYRYSNFVLFRGIIKRFCRERFIPVCNILIIE